MSEVTDAIDALVAKYEAQETVDDSAKTLLAGLSSQVRTLAETIVTNNAANTAAKASLLALTDKVDADTAEMAAAVSANTPTP